MFSQTVIAALLAAQAFFVSAAPLDGAALEKRITCHTTQVPINDACVDCYKLYTNATTCTRSVPLTCSYGSVNATTRKCQGVTCGAGTYVNDNGRQCVPCADTNAATCTSNSTLTCKNGFVLYKGVCQGGLPYAQYTGFGFQREFGVGPLGPTTPVPAVANICAQQLPGAQTIEFSGSAQTDPTCTGSTQQVMQVLVKMVDPTAAALLLGTCDDWFRNPYVRSQGAHHYCSNIYVNIP